MWKCFITNGIMNLEVAHQLKCIPQILWNYDDWGNVNTITKTVELAECIQKDITIVPLRLPFSLEYFFIIRIMPISLTFLVINHSGNILVWRELRACFFIKVIKYYLFLASGKAWFSATSRRNPKEYVASLLEMNLSKAL